MTCTTTSDAGFGPSRAATAMPSRPPGAQRRSKKPQGRPGRESHELVRGCPAAQPRAGDLSHAGAGLPLWSPQDRWLQPWDGGGHAAGGRAHRQLDIKVPAIVKTVFFDLFLFTTGYKVGPQFFRALKKDAVSQVALTVVLCVTCLVSAFVAAKLLGYDMGTAAGLLAGALAESTVIGAAGGAM